MTRHGHLYDVRIERKRPRRSRVVLLVSQECLLVHHLPPRRSLLRASGGFLLEVSILSLIGALTGGDGSDLDSGGSDARTLDLRRLKDDLQCTDEELLARDPANLAIPLPSVRTVEVERVSGTWDRVSVVHGAPDPLVLFSRRKDGSAAAKTSRPAVLRTCLRAAFGSRMTEVASGGWTPGSSGKRRRWRLGRSRT